jgi:hypothetical protein
MSSSSNLIKKQNADQNIFETKNDLISSLDFFICNINHAVGTGMTSLGYIYRCGFILAIFLTILCGFFSFLSYRFHLLIVAHTKCSTFEEIINTLFGKHYIFISFILSIYQVLIVELFYSRFIISTLKSMISLYLPDISDLYSDTLFLSLCLFAIIYLPIGLMPNFQFSVKISYVKFVFMFLCFYVLDLFYIT